MRRALHASGLAALILVASSAGVCRAALDHTYEVKPTKKAKFTKAAFRIWIPEEVETLRAVLVLVPGLNVNGLRLADSPEWRQFARDESLALVSCHLTGSGQKNYCIAEGGSAQALAKALREFAKLTERREVATLPMLLWGHSAGGQYAYGVAGYAPQRVIAFVAIKGGYYHSRPKPTIVKVPGLFIRGANDLPRRKKNITSAYNFGRRRRAAWCLAEEPRAGHEVGMSNRLIVPFFKSVLAGRVRTAEEARTIPSSACGMTITSGSRWRTISEGAVAKEICG